MDPPPPSSATVLSPTSSSASPGGTKLRLLCSYGGRIVPRPHDKALCYAGGETRLLAVDRRTATTSLAVLTSHISRTLLNGRPFCLKYQLPDHDLDSLVSVATDEDLTNMIDEYDRASFSANPTRLRFFIFPAAKAESSTADYDPRSEAWFFDALRSAGIAVDGKRSSESGSGGEGMMESEGKSGGTVDSSPCPAPGSGAMSSESVFLDTSSSLGSMRSAQPPVVNLPAIKVGAGEELGGVQGQDLKHTYSLVDSPESDSSATSPNFQSPTLVYLDSLCQSDSKDSKLFTNQMETDISTSDISPRTDQFNSMQTYGYSLSQTMDQMQQQASVLQTQVQVQAQAQLQPQPQPTLQSYQQLQPQYIHPGPQYVAQYYSSAVPAASYSTAYQPYLQQQQQQQQQKQQQQKQQATYQLNNSFPVYLMHVSQAQAQRDLTAAASLPSSHPQLLPNPPMMVTSPVMYDGLGPAKSADITAKVYRTGPTLSQPISVQSVSVPSEERQPQILAVAQMSPAQPVSVSSVVDGANYGGAAEFDDPLHAQIYKTQPPASPIASQRQVATNAATAMLLDNLTQLQLESTK